MSNASTQAPFITVIVPTYNRPQLLPVALASIKSQSYTSFECVVVNDYPEGQEAVDKTVEALDDTRFRVVHNPHSLGASGTRNKGIREAAGSIVAFLDDDDQWMSAYLAKHSAVYEQDDTVGVVCSGMRVEWQENALPPRQFIPKVAPEPPAIQSAMLNDEFDIFTTSALSFRKACVEEVGGFDESLPSFEEWELCYRIGEHYRIASITEPLTVFYQHLNYRMTGNIEQRKEGLEALLNKYNHEEGFVRFCRKYIAQIHFVNIKNNVLIGKATWNRQLFKKFLSHNTVSLSSRYEMKLAIKMMILVILGKPGFKIINLF